MFRMCRCFRWCWRSIIKIERITLWKANIFWLFSISPAKPCLMRNSRHMDYLLWRNIKCRYVDSDYSLHSPHKRCLTRNNHHMDYCCGGTSKVCFGSRTLVLKTTSTYRLYWTEATGCNSANQAACYTPTAQIREKHEALNPQCWNMKKDESA